jgi:hypothetical protein
VNPDDSPFAHVPAPDAGPSPLQDGPLTYEKVVASAGRASVYRTSGWRRTFGVFIGLVVVAVVLLGILVALLR